MSLKGSRCPKHPSQVLVGVCAFCLDERLAVLVNVEGLGEVDSSPWHTTAREPKKNGKGIPAVRDCVTSARRPCDIEIDRINNSNAMSVRRCSSLHDSRNVGTGNGNRVVLGGRSSDVSSMQGSEKKTLVSLFNVDDAENVPPKRTTVGHSDNKATVLNGFKGDERIDGSSSSLRHKLLSDNRNDAENSATEERIVGQCDRKANSTKGDERTGGSSSSLRYRLQSDSREDGQKNFRRGSFSERTETKESEDDGRFSWLSSLFRRKKSGRKLVEALTNFGERNEWADARRSWDAHSPLAWDKLGTSSCEVRRSSWEPARPSWEGRTRTPGGESMFSALDMLNESSSEVREDRELEFEDFVSYMKGEWGNFSVTEIVPTEQRMFDAENASRTKQDVLKVKDGHASDTKQALLNTPSLEETEMARTFVSSKSLQWQRDASTQTSPLKASAGCPDQRFFNQKTPQQQHHQPPHHHHQQPRAPPAWSRVLSLTRWALKHKHNESKQQAAMNLGEHTDQASTVSESSGPEPGLNKMYRAWDAYCSPMQKRDLDAQQHKSVVQKGEKVGDRSKNLDLPIFNLENGLLRFYITPARNTACSRTKRQQ